MKKLTTYQMATCGIMAGLLCVLGPLSIPIGPVPVSLSLFVIYLAVMLIGGKLASISVAIYLLLGLVGLPVFSGFSGGVAKLAGPTGGYLIGFIFSALIAGLFYEKFQKKLVYTVIGMVLGTAVAYTFGTIWFVIMMQVTVAYAISVCVAPFIVFDLIKIALAIGLGTVVNRALMKAGLTQ